ncbi:BA75_05274T0 [Komagataella pastoris]|uniref:BA75_05274T0 n=1 Tax=Komagataella pastoris TaxID=4922 RepID=A0A1B2JJS7_PICPA|nr:BA75_05274T0 [Komagataella pastoris]
MIPTPSADTTAIWTGDHTTWTTDDEGNIIEQVPSPSAGTTAIWTGTETSWTTEVGDDGSSTTVKLIPTPSADTTAIWTGDHTTWTTEVVTMEAAQSLSLHLRKVVLLQTLCKHQSLVLELITELLVLTDLTLQFTIILQIITNLPMKSVYELWYENLGLVTTATGVSNINFDTDLSWPYYIDRDDLGNTGSYVNATIEYEGFFRAPVDGEYEFCSVILTTTQFVFGKYYCY